MSKHLNVNLDEPRYDQDTYTGRAMHFFGVTNPLNLFVSAQTLENARTIVQKHRAKQPLPENITEEDLWQAKTLYDSAFHPDTGEKMIIIGRMSAQVPMNMIITGGMMTFYQSTPAVLFWQWLNQSFNALVNYTNRSGNATFTTSQLLTSYVAATAGAVTAAVGLNKMVKIQINPAEYVHSLRIGENTKRALLNQKKTSYMSGHFGGNYINPHIGNINSLESAFIPLGMVRVVASVVDYTNLPPLVRRCVPFGAVVSANCINIPMMRIHEPRYDQDTFWGRFQHFFETTNPINLLASSKTLENSRMLVTKHKNKEPLPPGTTEEDLWKAKRIYDSAFHPDTGEKMLLIGRMSAQVPMNTLITAGLIIWYKSFYEILFWQWINQSFNASVNYTNRSGDAKFTIPQMLTSYVCATSGAVGTAVGLNRMVKHLPPLIGNWVPFVAVAAANCINIPMMRIR